MDSFASLVALLATLSSSLICRTYSASCTGDCFPATRDLSAIAGVSITSNSTCGLEAAEDFCVNQVCTHKCDATVPSQFHGVNLTIDKFEEKTYWKSQNFQENVVLELRLGHTYFLTEIFATFQFEYPAAMYFAKSNDFGTSWKTLGYLSTDCQEYFGMDAVEENSRNGFAVECIRLDPATASENPQATYSPWRDTAFSSNIISNYTLQEEFLATNFRLVLVKFKTPSGFNPKTADKRSFYFAVKDWHIDGHCYCKGQTDECNKEESWKCDCLKNTTGDNCEKCPPLFNNVKYKEGKACEECQCHNHSSSCSFNETKGHGVCQDCTGHTTGDACAECLPHYFNTAVPLEHPERCQACDCNPSGVTNQPSSDLCNQTTGQCDCKDNVTSRTCGECKDGYWNLTKSNPYGCQICECEVAGTVESSNVCDKKTGQCPCRKSLAGLSCTKCKDGYYGLTYENSRFCEECSCFPEGSVNITCDQTSGHCYCRQNFNGRNCSTLAPRHYVPGVPQLTYEAMKPGSSTLYNATSGVSGVLIDGYSASRSLSFNVDIPKTSVYTIVLRYQTVSDWRNATLTVESLSTPFQPYSCDGMKPVTNQSFTLTATLEHQTDAANFGDSCMSEGQFRLTLEFPLITLRSLSPSVILVDSLVLLPSVKSFKYPPLTNETLFYYRQSFSHTSWSRNKTEIQKSLGPYFSALYGGGKACFCNETGSLNLNVTCDPNGGQCSCKSNVAGLSCDRCEPANYNFSASGCQLCNCDPVGSNSSQCDLVTGKCHCKRGVEGMQCDRCKVDYYGFKRGIGCSACLCDSTYSTNPQCDENGVCDCLPGVNEQKCTACNDTSFNLTTKGCGPCNCDIDGSATLTCDKQTGNCSCKSMAVGPKCDSCPRGYFYGLSKYHPGGCLKCQCSGKSVNCTSKSNTYETSVKTESDPTVNVFRYDGWSVPGVTLKPKFHHIGKLGLRWLSGATISSNENVYFVAPDKYLGDKRNAYQHSLSFYLSQDDTPLHPFNSSGGDVILKGRWFNRSLVHKFNKIPGKDPSKFTVFFGEGHWTVDDINGRNASTYELIAVLSELTDLFIRAKWSNKTGVTTSIGVINMYLSREYRNTSEVPSGARMTKSVEKCDCPPEFIGDSCQTCSPGFTRAVPNTGPYKPCVPCQCNGNTDECHSETGVCIQCKHNTTGDHCEQCVAGYYGNASLGTPGACRECSCYGGHKTCNLTENKSTFVCNCGPGFEGRQCEVCSDGYFGIPKLGGRCEPCNCSGNSETCNRTTGDCSAFCQSNTTGFNCEWCRDSFFADASAKTCQECNCTDLGSVNDICDRTTGNCTCQKNVEGKSCSHCSRDAWGYDNGTGCTVCNCSQHGSITGQCNMTTGACSCKQNVTGDKCYQCTPGLYDVTKGCIDCQCNMTYSNSSTCNTYNGQCDCKQSSDGGFYGGRQCTECRWDAIGSFPSCAQCNETCYVNWYWLIELEREKARRLAENVSDVLQTFNGTSVEDIDKTLSELNTKLNESEVIFSGARYNTEEKEKRFKSINQSMVELLEMLEQVNKSVIEIRNYLSDVVEPFDGTVNVTSEKPPVLANYTSLRVWADEILENVTFYNTTAYQYYNNITTHFEEIRRYNTSGTTAATEVKQATERLDEIANKTSEANSILNKEFYDLVKRNNEELEELRKDSENISRLVNESSELSRKTTQMLNYAQRNLSAARNEANTNLRESTGVYNNTVEAQQIAYKARNTSAEFKTNSTDLLNKVEAAITDVKDGIDGMALAKENIENATVIANSVLAMTIPVSQKTIHDLSTEILNIAINETLVNATYDDATAGLRTAQEAQRLSEEAMNISKNALAQVKEIELKIQEAKRYRDEAKRLQNSTDEMVEEIVRITSEVDTEFSNASKIGHETLYLLNKTIEDIDNSLKCFNESKDLAMNASNMANLAYKQILDASMTHNDSRTKLRNIEVSLNSSYNIAMESYREIIETNQNAAKLYEEVKEAEDLLKSYIEQRNEMDELQAEVTLLETELDSLNEDLDKRLNDYKDCAND